MSRPRPLRPPLALLALLALLAGGGRGERLAAAGGQRVPVLVSLAKLGLQESLQAFLPSNADEFCWQRSYGRGVGVPAASCRQGKELSMGLCYPVCSAETGYGVGPLCWKGIWARGRGIGELPLCAEGQDYEATLCYERCRPGFHGIGPVCWGRCPASLPVACVAGCAKTDEACAGNVMDHLSALFPAGGIHNIAVAIVQRVHTQLILEIAKRIGKETVTQTKNAAKELAKQAVGDIPKMLAEGFVEGVQREFAAGATESGMLEALARTTNVTRETLVKTLAAAKKSMDQMASDPANAFKTFDWTVIDPFGLASAIKSFMRPLCEELER